MASWWSVNHSGGRRATRRGGEDAGGRGRWKMTVGVSRCGSVSVVRAAEADPAVAAASGRPAGRGSFAGEKEEPARWAVLWEEKDGYWAVRWIVFHLPCYG